MGISAGTGFAPFRGFLHERKSRNASGKNFVFFGCRNEKTDILYENELDEWKNSGFINLFYAFSRSENHEKKYVQDVIKDNKKDVFQLIYDEGAHIYVCGSGAGMGVGVREVLLEI